MKMFKFCSENIKMKSPRLFEMPGISFFSPNQFTSKDTIDLLGIIMAPLEMRSKFPLASVEPEFHLME